MAWYAQVKNGSVTEVTYLVDNLDSSWLYREYGGTWLRCTEDGSLRNVFPTVGYTYDEKEDKFFPPQPYPSWVYNAVTKSWEAPVPYPTDGNVYFWNEPTVSWVVAPQE